MMSHLINRLRALTTANAGSVVTEFALLGPTFIAMMLGVLQIGVGMQNYNALRAIAADVSRYAVVDYQSKATAEQVTSEELATYARSIATKAPYGLKNTSLSVRVVSVLNSRVAGTVEKRVTLVYSVDSVLEIIGFEEFPITYSQPMFLVST